MSDAEDRFLDEQMALDRWRDEARELSDDELRRTLESAGYPAQISKITSYAGLGNLHRGSAVEVIEKVTDKLTDLIARIRSRNLVDVDIPSTAAAVLSEVLKLRTVYFYYSYSVPDDCIPQDADDFDADEEYHETDEYEPRNKMLAQLMSLLLVGANAARSLGEPLPHHFIEAIRLLRESCNESTGDGLESDDAKRLLAETQDGLRELAVLAKLAKPVKDTDTAVDLLKDFFAPENGHYGISEIWYSDSNKTEDQSKADEKWAQEHIGKKVGRFEIGYENGLLSLTDKDHAKRRKKAEFTYEKLAQCGKIRFEAVIALLRQLEADGGTPKTAITPPEGRNWRGQFQTGRNGKMTVAYRFYNAQIERPKDENGGDTALWRFKTNTEVEDSRSDEQTKF